MPLIDEISEQIKTAMRAKQVDRLSALRMIKTALAKAELDSKDGIDEEGAKKVLGTLAKQRRDSIEQFREGGREEMAQKEERELEIVKEFLPAELSEEKIDEIIEQTLAEIGEVDAKQMGRVTGQVMKALKAAGGMFDGKAVSQKIRSRLGG